MPRENSTQPAPKTIFCCAGTDVESIGQIQVDSESVLDRHRSAERLSPTINAQWPEVIELLRQLQAKVDLQAKQIKALEAHTGYGKSANIPCQEPDEEVETAPGEHDGDLELEGNIWDTGMLLFLPDMDTLTMTEKALGAILCLGNQAFQLLFVMAIFTSMSEFPYSDVERSGMLRERLLRNHPLDAIDNARHLTRAGLLCEGMLHNTLGSTWNSVSSYLDADPLKVGFVTVPGVPGYVICLIAMIIWTLKMLQEIRTCLNLILGIVLLDGSRKNPRSSFLHDGVIGGCVRSIDVPRKLAILLSVMLPRLVIALALLIGGQYFLSVSATVEDLVLNACALEIVKDMDELLFQSLMSKHAQAVLVKTFLRVQAKGPAGSAGRWFVPFLVPEVSKPLTEGAFWSAQLSGPWRLLLCLVLVFGGYWSFLRETVKEMEEAKRIICENDLNFAFAPHPATGLPLFTQVDDPGDRSSQGLQCYHDARYEMVKMRAGFYPELMDVLQDEELYKMVAGTHHRCKDWHPDRQGIDPARDLACLTTSSDIVFSVADMDSMQILQGSNCMDQDVAFMFLRKTCLGNTSYAKATPMINLLRTRDTCADMKDLCCSGPHCPQRIHNVKVDRPLLNKLIALCPASCGNCISGPPPVGG